MNRDEILKIAAEAGAFWELSETPEKDAVFLMRFAERAIRAAIEQYDQTSLELCEECGWRAMIPGDGCLVCARQKAPRQWVELTDEEVHEGFCHVEYETPNDWNTDPDDWCQQFARYLEAKLKEKNT